MGLSVTLGNALSGMKVNQSALDVLSRNVSNAGTPGYHRQSLNVADQLGTNSSYVAASGVNRTFNQSLQAYYNRQVSDTASSGVAAGFLDRLQAFLGKPGTVGSLDTQFGKFQNAIQALATSPDDFSVRAQTLTDAQALVETLNRLTGAVQGMRQETEGQIAARVGEVNGMLKSLEEVNLRLGDQGIDPTSRATLSDQRDRLVAGIAEVVDVRATYRPDGSVALMTRAGIGLIDKNASTFEFTPAGNISAGSLFNRDPAENGVGTLTIVSASGLRLDLVQQGGLQSGELAGLLKLRDETLVTAQSQLDEIAAGLAQALSTVSTPGTAATAGAATGFDIDLAAIQPGNDFILAYSEGGVDKTVKVVRLDDATKLPMDYVDANGTRVIGIDFSGTYADVATDLQAALGPGLAITNPAGSTLRVLDDGAPNTTDIASLTSRTTVTGTQSGQTALSLFVDSGNAAFTNNLAGATQKLGFAGRISLNSAVVADNRLLVQTTVGGSLGNAARPNFLRDQLGSMQFTSGGPATATDEAFPLNGTLGQIISQVVNYQGSTVATALSQRDSQALTLETIEVQMQSEYGVDVDEEMARLMELQNAYAANARVVSIVQDLLDTLMAI